MDTVSIYMLISFVLAVEFSILVGQSILISRVHKTAPWALFAVGWTGIGVRQVWTMLKIPLQVEELRARNLPIPPITTESMVMIGSAILIGILFIIGHDILRRHYQRIGI